MLALIDYGAGNLRSVEFALERLGVPHRRVADAAGLASVERILLPGVGAAGHAMRELERRGLAEPLRETPLPLLGVCLGMQLLAGRSEEGEGVAGLGAVAGEARRFDSRLRVPHIGWNEVELSADPLFEGLGPRAHFFFLHSYRLECPREVVIGEAEYGGRFPAAVRAGSRAGVQFHPEKSGGAGLRVLANFCRAGDAWGTW